MPNLIYNALRTPDGTILESRHRHDFRTHTDANGKHYMVDGGLAYERRSAHGDEVILSRYDDEPHDEQRQIITWGSYGKEGKSPLRYIKIADMETDHIKAVLKECNPQQVIRVCMEHELIAREEGK